MASVSGTSFVPFDFPRDLQSSPYVSAGADFSLASGSLRSDGQRVFFGSFPGTSGLLAKFLFTILMLTTLLIRMIRNLLL